MFISLDRTEQLLRALGYQGYSASRCPSRLTRVLLGRALGRIAAHEIGHYLAGPAHASAGLMKAMLSPDDLIGAVPPRYYAPSLQ